MQNTLVNYHQNRKKYMTIRRNIYLFFIVFGVINIFFPFQAHADVLGYQIQDVYAQITENVNETNDILAKAFEFTRTSPYDVVNKLAGTEQGTLAIAIRNATKTMALVVATFLLMVEFVRKTVNFEWASKWENVLIFIVKILIMKQVVQNADNIVGCLYAAFDSINATITETDINFLPCAGTTRYTCEVNQKLAEQLQKGWWDFWYDVGAGDTTNTYYYDISMSAVHIFYPDATAPSSLDLNNTPFANPTTKLNFTPTIEMIFNLPFFLTMKAIAYIVFVIAIGRIFELALYTMFAPLPLATLASDGTHDVAKSFIKNYIATVLQIAVIATMFLIYVSVNKYVREVFPDTKLSSFIVLLALGLSVIKSGTWARKICGIG